MSPALWAFAGTVAAPVLALLTTIWVELRKARHRATDSSNGQLQSAVIELLTRSVQLHSRVTQIRGHSQAHASIGGLIDQLLRAKVPMDWVQLFEPLNREMELLVRANAELWVGHDQDTVRLGNDVAVAAAGVIDAVIASTKPARRRRLFGLWPTSQSQTDEATKAAIEQLTASRTALATHARDRLGLPTANLMALSQQQMISS